MASYYKTIAYWKIGGKVMADMVAGILLLITFIGLIVYCFKGGNLLIGFITTAVLWCIIGLVPLETVVNVVFEQSVESYGKTIAIIVFGAKQEMVRSEERRLPATSRWSQPCC